MLFSFALFIALVCLAVLGHSFLWVAYVNRIHALAWPRPLIKLLGWPALLVVIPLGCLYWAWRLYTAFTSPVEQSTAWATIRQSFSFYDWLCVLSGIWAIIRWCWWRWIGDPWVLSTTSRTQTVDVEQVLAQRLSEGKRSSMVRLWPWNCSWQLELLEQELPLPRLPPAWQGLRIAHLSDWHFTGHVKRAYFDYIVDQVNAWQPDLIFLTGDLIDEIECLPWITTTLGRLQSRYGRFYILGNHDPRIGNLPLLHETLQTAGLIDAGGHWRLLNIQGHPLLIAGSEQPWLGPAADLEYAPREQQGQQLFRILLSHSPDQFEQAVAHDFDLQLSGHTHGGQVALPWIGPIFAPSRYGIRLVRGNYRRQQTVLHVTRGLSAATPIRWNCLPQASLLTLQTIAESKRSN